MKNIELDTVKQYNRYSFSRLNLDYLFEDLTEFLNKEKDSKYQSYLNVLEWIASYSKDIKSNIDEIKTHIEKAFPTCIIKIDSGHDDGSVFFVHIYGLKRHKCLKHNDIAYAVLENFEERFRKYCLIPSFKDITTTRKYYPEIYKQLKQKEENVKKSNII